MTTAWTLAGSVFAAILLLAPESRAEDRCILTQVAHLPMTIGPDGRASVPMAINGRTVSMLIDTGHTISQMSAPAATRLGLTPQSYNPQHSHWYGNQYLDQYVAVRNVSLGAMSSDAMQLALVPAGTLPADYDGTLVPDILQHFDFELDFAGGFFSLYSRDHCRGQFYHWTQDAYATIPFSKDEFGHIYFPIELDGLEYRAELDTAAKFSQLAMRQFTSIAGVVDTDPRLTMMSRSHEGAEYKYPFKSLTFGGIGISNPGVRLEQGSFSIGDERSEALIGMDVLRKLHLYVAYGDEVIYATAASAR